MPVICRFLGIVVAMYYKDHGPPHFHAKYGGQEALIEIESGAYTGYLPPRAMALAQEWREKHLDALRNDWEHAQQGRPLMPIEPLE